MAPLKSETNIEVLRGFAKHLLVLVDTLTKENQTLKDASEKEKQEWLDRELKDKFTRLRAMYFAHGKEKLITDGERKVGRQGEQLTLHGTHEKPDDVRVREELPPGPQYNYKMSDRQLKAESVIRGLRAGHEAWEEVKGFYQTSYMVNYVERRYFKEVHSQCKYRLKRAYNPLGKEVLVTAPGPAKLRPGSRYSLDFAVAVAVDKYEYHLPLERQRCQM